MLSNSINVEYPAHFPDALQTTPAAFAQEARMAMAVKLFEMKRLSSGMAAQLAGMERVTFLLNLHRYGVPMLDLSMDELEADLANA
jgi:predicted HTH domain antitoxin